MFPSLGGALGSRGPATASEGQPGKRIDPLVRSSLPPAFEEIVAQRGQATSPGHARPIDLSAPSSLPSPLHGAEPSKQNAKTAASHAPASVPAPEARNGETHGVLPAGAAVPGGKARLKEPDAAPAHSPASPSSVADKVSPKPAPVAAEETPVGPAVSTHEAAGPAAPASPKAGFEDIAVRAVSDAMKSAVATPTETTPPLSGTVRTLEDTLAEVLRPVVRQWVIENMPRIVEEVAKQEVAKLPKPTDEA
jgi:cell pole-organizing protein PopZ